MSQRDNIPAKTAITFRRQISNDTLGAPCEVMAELRGCSKVKLIELTAFRWLPEFTHGYVKDLRVRWALEEAGLEYDVVLVDAASKNTDAYRKWQPFGQVPAYRDDEVEMFESGAIVLRIATHSPALAPADPASYARVSSWVFAALNSVEPVVKAFQESQNEANEQGAGAQVRRSSAEAHLMTRLTELAAWLADEPYLEGTFSAGDLMMTTVLREIGDSEMLRRLPTLDALRLRCQARPAFQRALAAQLKTFNDNDPTAASPIHRGAIHR